MHINNPTKTITGMYFWINACLLKSFAFFAYFLLSIAKFPLIFSTRSNRSPCSNTSLMFLVMIDWISCKSSFNFSKFLCVRWSEYNFFVFWMNVSNLMNAYGRATESTVAPCLSANSRCSSGYVNNIREYIRWVIVRQNLEWKRCVSIKSYTRKSEQKRSSVWCFNALTFQVRIR